MQTIKTGVVVALLIAVCYGAFVALNAPEADIPEELQQWANSENVEDILDIEMPSFDGFAGNSATPTNGADIANSFSMPDAGLPSLPSPNGFANSANQGLPNTEVPEFPMVDEWETEVSAGAATNGLAASGNTPTTALPTPELPSLATAGSSEFDDKPSVKGEFVATRNDVDWNNDPTSLDLPLLDEANDLTNLGPGLDSDLGVASATSSASAKPSPPSLPFTIAREQALQLASSGELLKALRMLSAYYDSPEIGHAEHSDLVDILDALSREVIFSRRSLIEMPYQVEATDTLASIAAKYNVSPELLATINGQADTNAAVSGTKLKVLQGPFRSVVSLSRGELTIFLGDLYAVRFPLSIGKENVPTVGTFEVVDRRRDRTYYGPGGNPIGAEDPTNPYGGYWLSLGNNLSIHGSPEMTTTELAEAGCISLAPLDAKDAYMILTKGSQVEIIR